MSPVAEMFNLPVKCCNTYNSVNLKNVSMIFCRFTYTPEIVHADIKTNGYKL